MPVSDIHNFTPILEEVLRRNPSSVLDLGVGMGLYGALLRQYLDVAPGRLRPDQWEKVIVGVEGFADYNNPVWSMYTYVEQTDFSQPEEVIRYNGFDVVLMIDSLEHLPQATGTWMLDALIRHNKAVIVSLPMGSNYLEQGAEFGNEFERHRHKWEKDDIIVRNGKILYEGVCTIAVFEGAR